MEDWDWPYQIILYTDDYEEIQDWCYKNIGEFDKDWYKLGIDPMQYFALGYKTTTWLFKREKDAMFFKLRWL
jgi:hypothetical protein